ncbi:MAG TPA: M36 family metallopeptidase [Polyangiaceae bacterium]|nr:M36 family metallopeptidase [Polyangiaceae bacterium]
MRAATDALRLTRYKSVIGEHYGTPKELWGFRSRATSQSANPLARAFISANAELLGVEEVLNTIRHRRTVVSLGARHVIFEQVHAGRRVHRAYVTVHVANDGSVYLVKNRAAPRAYLPKDAAFAISARQAAGYARHALRGKGSVVVKGVEELWFPRNARLIPAVRVRLRRAHPSQDWLVYVDARNGRILSRYDNLASASGKGKVFDPSPVTALGEHVSLLGKRRRPKPPPPTAYRDVTLRGLSRGGHLDGSHVTTNATAAHKRVRSRSLNFCFSSQQRGFEEVMVYCHVDSVVRYLGSLGFRGRRAIFSAPLRANVNGTRDDNSWYSPTDRVLTFGTGEIDDAEDGETIVHELGHAIQDAIVPDFGQSKEAAAMGEGFGDYLAASFFADKKPEKYQTSVMTWDGLLIGLEDGSDPPALRRVDSKSTYADFSARGDEHDNGQIWSATLWDVRRALGATEADRVIIESHFQLDGFTTFARGARAIIDADRNLSGGRHEQALRRIMKKRRISPL